MACETIACNTTDEAVKKVRPHGEAGSVDKLCIPELRNMVGDLQSTVGGLCTVQSEKKKGREEEDRMLEEKFWGCAEDTREEGVS